MQFSIISCRTEKWKQCPEVSEQHLGLQLAQPGKSITSQGDYCISASQFHNSLVHSSLGVVQKEECAVEETHFLKPVLLL